MGTMIGMDPEQVLALANRLSGFEARLNTVAAEIHREAMPAADPAGFVADVGDLLLHPADLWITISAQNNVRHAINTLAELRTELTRNAVEQKIVSETDKTPTSDALLDAINNPDTPDMPEDISPGDLDNWVFGLITAAETAQKMGDKGFNVWVWKAAQYIADGSTRDPVTGKYRLPNGFLVSEGDALKIRDPDTGKLIKINIRPGFTPPGSVAPRIRIPVWIGRGVKILGAAGLVIGGLITGYDAWAAQWNADEGKGYSDSERWARSLWRAGLVTAGSIGVGALGSWLGGLAGGAVVGLIGGGGGAAVGGPWGAAGGGGLGSLIGTAVGSAVGGFFGGWAGEELGNWGADLTVDWFGSLFA